MVISPPNLVTQALFNTLRSFPQNQSPQPRIIIISSTGLTKESHAALPLLMKPIYGYLLRSPHKDKIGVERLVSHCAGWPWTADPDEEPDASIMGSTDWMNTPGLPPPGSLHRVLVLRPAFLTDGESIADKNSNADGVPAYRVSEEELGGYTISRRDVAHFVTDAVLNRWDEFENKCVSIAY